MCWPGRVRMPRRSRRRSTRLPTSPPASTAITPLCTAISRGVWLGSGGRAGGGGLRRGLREAQSATTHPSRACGPGCSGSPLAWRSGIGREERELRAYARTGVDPCSPSHEVRATERASSAAAGPALAAALAALSREERDVLLLYAWAELGYPEIAAALSNPPGTVKSRLNARARACVNRSPPQASSTRGSCPMNELDLSDPSARTCRGQAPRRRPAPAAAGKRPSWRRQPPRWAPRAAIVAALVAVAAIAARWARQ